MAASRKPSPLLSADAAREARARLAVLDSIEASLTKALGETWRVTYGDAARAVAEPYVLRVLAGESGPPLVSDESIEAASASDAMRLRACEMDIAESLGLDPRDLSREWADYVAAVESLNHKCADRGVELDRLQDEVESLRAELAKADQINGARILAGGYTAIDDSTPEGVLALLDAAVDAMERHAVDGSWDDQHHFGTACRQVEVARDRIAARLSLPLRRPLQLAEAEAAAVPRRHRVVMRAEALAESRGRDYLLALVTKRAEALPGYLLDVEPERASHLVRAYCEEIAAAALALGGVE